MSNKRYALLGLLAIIAVAAFFRLWEIKSIPPGFYPDEAMNGNNANEAWETSPPAGGFKLFYPENNGREGLWINIMAPLMAVFGNQPWVPRSVAAIFGILTVLGLFLLSRELFRENLKSQISNPKVSRSEIIALLASFFLAASFWHINFSRIGFRAILTPFFLVWSFYFLWKVVSRKSGVEKLHSTFYILLSGLLFGLGFHTYIAYRLAPLLLIIPFILLWRLGRKKLIFIFLIFAFLASLPIGLYFLKNPQDFLGRASQVSIFASQTPLKDLGINIAKTIGMFFYRGDYNWRHNLSGSPQLWWPVAILFLIGLIISIKNLRVAGCALLVIWFIVMLIPAVISSEGLPHALRSIAALPAVMIFAGLGLEWLIAKWKNSYFSRSVRKKFALLLLFTFLLSAVSSAYNQYFFRWAPNINVYYAFGANYVELGKYLKALPENIPKYVIINADGIDVHGIPMPSQTVMFITKTYLPKWQNEKNIFYITMPNLDSFIQEVNQKGHFYITMLETDAGLRKLLKQKITDLKIDASSGIIAFYR